MRIEDALVHGLALAVAAVLFVGLAQALDGRSRHTRPVIRRRGLFGFPLSRPAAVDDPFIPIAGEFPTAGSARLESMPGDESPFLPGPLIRIRPVAMLAATVTAPPLPAVVGEAMQAEEVVLEDVALDESARPLAPEPAPDLDPLTRCLDLYEAGAPAEAAAAASSRQRIPSKRGPRRSSDRVLLDTMAGLAWAATGDKARADASLAAALLALGGTGEVRGLLEPREPTERVGRHLLGAATTSADRATAHESVLALASAWVDLGGPADPAVAEALEHARGDYADAVEARIQGLCERGKLAAAQRVSAEPACAAIVPAVRRETLEGVWWRRVSEEVGRLTGQAVEGAPGDARDGLASIERAESLVGALPPGAVTAERRHGLTRRLWWGYMKLGMERLGRGDPDGALEPLFRALLLGAGDADRQTEARRSLARAVDGLVDRLETESLERLREGDVHGAMADSRRLSEVVDGALERGLSQEDLAGALGRRQGLLLQIAAA